MKFDIYGHFELEVTRERDGWRVYRIGTGIKSRVYDVVLPDDLAEEDIAGFLDDIFHEGSLPGQCVKQIF